MYPLYWDKGVISHYKKKDLLPLFPLQMRRKMPLHQCKESQLGDDWVHCSETVQGAALVLVSRRWNLNPHDWRFIKYQDMHELHEAKQSSGRFLFLFISSSSSWQRCSPHTRTDATMYVGCPRCTWLSTVVLARYANWPPAASLGVSHSWSSKCSCEMRF